jgi:hypothetical protein
MPDAFTVASFVQLLQVFAPCFTAPSFSTFVTLMGGWSLATGRLRAARDRWVGLASAAHRYPHPQSRLPRLDGSASRSLPMGGP